MWLESPCPTGSQESLQNSGDGSAETSCTHQVQTSLPFHGLSDTHTRFSAFGAELAINEKGQKQDQ